MNVELAQKAPRVACINASVEESTISSRDAGCVLKSFEPFVDLLFGRRLLPQDAFVEANVTVKPNRFSLLFRSYLIPYGACSLTT